MRLLLRCTDCQRQYDASGREIGSRFRCRCGSVVTVASARGHDAAVVRCSACGAPRQQGAANCQHCGSDFTLHEKDLHTVCPGCLSRVSDRARFCHHCATALESVSATGGMTELTCPACQNGRRLTSRLVPALQTAVMECGRCAGLWLANHSFAQLASRAARPRLDDAWGVKHRAPPEGPPEPQTQPPSKNGSFYRPCAECGKLMPRRHYAHRSGVVIDICRDHGVWFDADELPRILAWIQAGGRTDPIPAVQKSSAAPVPTARPAASPVSADDELDRWRWLAEAALETLWRVFR